MSKVHIHQNYSFYLKNAILFSLQRSYSAKLYKVVIIYFILLISQKRDDPHLITKRALSTPIANSTSFLAACRCSCKIPFYVSLRGWNSFNKCKPKKIYTINKIISYIIFVPVDGISHFWSKIFC